MRTRRTAAIPDLLLILLGLVGLLVLAYRFDLVGWVGPRSAWLTPLHPHEFLLALLYLMIALKLFAWRRLREQRRTMAALLAAEAAGRESAARFWLVVSLAPIALIALDSTGRFTLAEGRGLAAAGLRPSDLVGHSIFDLFAAAPQVLALARRALAGEEFTATTAVAGAVFETRHVILRDDRGTVTGLIGVATDVTARHRAEQALHASEAQRARERAAGGRRQFHLTDQESRVLDLLAAERTNAEIAAALHIQPGTVGTHIHNIGAKLGLPTGRIGREAVRAAAREQGLLPPSAPPATDDHAPPPQV